MSQLKEKSERISNRTQEAKRIGEEAYLNASKTLEILENFNSSLNSLKSRANEAKKLEETITKNLDETRSTNRNLTSRLDAARGDLNQAASNAALTKQQIGTANKVTQSSKIPI